MPKFQVFRDAESRKGMKYGTEDVARADPRRRLPLPAFGAQFLRRLRRNQYVNPKVFADVPGYRATKIESDRSDLIHATGRELAGQIKGHSLLVVCDHDPWSRYWPVADLDVLVNWSSPYAPAELLTPLTLCLLHDGARLVVTLREAGSAEFHRPYMCG